MKRLHLMLVMIGMVGIMSLTGCYKYVEPGHEAMKVWVAGGKTGEQEHLPAGRYWSTYRTDYFEFPVFEQTIQYRGADSFEFTVEGLKVNMEIGASYTISDVETLFRRYRKGVDEINQTHLRNIIRDALNQETRSLTMEQIYGQDANDMMERVFASVHERLLPVGINLSGIYMIGRPQFPQQVDMAIQERIKATQRSEQREIELREAEAQANINRATARGEGDAVLIRAEAEAKAIQEITRSLTPVYVQYLATQTWDGKQPQVLGSGNNPILRMD